jgi:AcrR family transcriptional regulator
MTKKNKSVIYSTSQITKSLLSLMEIKPFKDIKISEICKKADLTRPTFYNHYKDKEGVLCDTIDELWDGIILNKKIEDLDSHKLLNFFFEECHSHRVFIILLIENNFLDLFIQRFSVKFNELYDMVEFSFKPESQLERELGAAFISYSLMGVVSYWLINKIDYSSNDLVLYVEKLLNLR